jgi:hypothetical protein
MFIYIYIYIQIVAGIDTTLTPEQRINVDKLKKQISGGPASQKIRCKFSYINIYNIWCNVYIWCIYIYIYKYVYLNVYILLYVYTYIC